jgi:predicted CoA-binding protein
MDPRLEDVIGRILAETKTVAVVGLSDRPDRPSHDVARYLQKRGYRIIPVNPNVREVLGEPSYGSLAEIPGAVDLVDVFRKPEFVPGIASQEGIVSERARKELAAAGIPVVMDRCVKKELARRGR